MTHVSAMPRFGRSYEIVCRKKEVNAVKSALEEAQKAKGKEIVICVGDLPLILEESRLPELRVDVYNHIWDMLEYPSGTRTLTVFTQDHVQYGRDRRNNEIQRIDARNNWTKNKQELEQALQEAGKHYDADHVNDLESAKKAHAEAGMRLLNDAKSDTEAFEALQSYPKWETKLPDVQKALGQARQQHLEQVKQQVANGQKQREQERHEAANRQELEQALEAAGRQFDADHANDVAQAERTYLEAFQTVLRQAATDPNAAKQLLDNPHPKPDAKLAEVKAQIAMAREQRLEEVKRQVTEAQQKNPDPSVRNLVNPIESSAAKLQDKGRERDKTMPFLSTDVMKLLPQGLFDVDDGSVISPSLPFLRGTTNWVKARTNDAINLLKAGKKKLFGG